MNVSEECKLTDQDDVANEIEAYRHIYMTEQLSGDPSLRVTYDYGVRLSRSSNREDLAEASDLFEELLRQGFEPALTQYYLGVTRFDLGHFREALAAVGAAAEADPLWEAPRALRDIIEERIWRESRKLFLFVD
eukprot:337711_1